MGDGELKAKARLGQISSHLEAPSSTLGPDKLRRRKREKTAGPPADWSDTLEQLDRLRSIAGNPPTTNKAYIRQKQAGKLWVRERIELLLDKDSFREVGSVSGTVKWGEQQGAQEEIKSFIQSNNTQGFGTIEGRKVLLTADDFTIRAGHADGANGAKTLYIEKLAVELRLPIIKLVDGSSGGGSVTTIKTEGFSYIPPMTTFHQIVKQLDMGIPNLAAILGPAIGLGAARATACHFSTMASSVGALFNAGPKVVAKATFEEGLSATDLGGPAIHCTNGTIDNPCADERACMDALKTFLSYVPSCGHTQLPPVLDTEDPIDRDVSGLRALIPRRRQRAYNMRRLVTTVVDEGTFFEIGPVWGLTGIVGLARMRGRPIGIIASNPEKGNGAIDALAAQKMVRHIKLCEVFNLPIVQFVDCPGYAIGTAAERSATMKWGVELGKAYYGSTVPLFNFVVRKCYGVAGGLMVDCRDPHQRVAWPSGEWGSLPLEGGIEASHSAELRSAGKEADVRYDELMAEYTRLQNPIRTANAFDVEEIIDPADTRSLACAWVEHIYSVKLPERLVDRQAGRIHPVFR